MLHEANKLIVSLTWADMSVVSDIKNKALRLTLSKLLDASVSSETFEEIIVQSYGC